MWGILQPFGYVTDPNQMRALSEQEILMQAAQAWALQQQADVWTQMRYNNWQNMRDANSRAWVEYDERLGYCYEVQ